MSEGEQHVAVAESAPGRDMAPCAAAAPSTPGDATPSASELARERVESLLKLRASGLTIKAAARKVGLEYTTARSYCSRYKKRLAELSLERFQSEAPDAIEHLSKMMRSAKTPANTRLAALLGWLDRAGYVVVKRSEVNLTATLRDETDAALRQRVLEAFNGSEEKAALFTECYRRIRDGERPAWPAEDAAEAA